MESYYLRCQVEMRSTGEITSGLTVVDSNSLETVTSPS